MIRYLSVEGDRETIYLWREQTTRGSKGGPGTGYQKMQGILRKKRFVFFSCRICTDIDPACESQELEDRVFRTYSESIDYKNHPRPETSHFSDELEHMNSGTEDVSMHFSGHGDASAGGLCWHGFAGRWQKEMQIRGKPLTFLIKRSDVVHKIDSFFLNACCTLATGLELLAVGIRVVVCWQSPVTDETVHDFALRFIIIHAKRMESMTRPLRMRATSSRSPCPKRDRASYKLAAANRSCRV